MHSQPGTMEERWERFLLPSGVSPQNGVFLLILHSFALSEVWIQVSPAWEPEGLEKPWKGVQGLLFPALGKIPLKQPKSWEASASAGTGTETRKTLTSRGRRKHRELPTGQNPIKPDP